MHARRPIKETDITQTTSPIQYALIVTEHSLRYDAEPNDSTVLQTNGPFLSREDASKFGDNAVSVYEQFNSTRKDRGPEDEYEVGYMVYPLTMVQPTLESLLGN